MCFFTDIHHCTLLLSIRLLVLIFFDFIKISAYSYFNVFIFLLFFLLPWCWSYTKMVYPSLQIVSYLSIFSNHLNLGIFSSKCIIFGPIFADKKIIF